MRKRHLSSTLRRDRPISIRPPLRVPLCLYAYSGTVSISIDSERPYPPRYGRRHLCPCAIASAQPRSTVTCQTCWLPVSPGSQASCASMSGRNQFLVNSRSFLVMLTQEISPAAPVTCTDAFGPSHAAALKLPTSTFLPRLFRTALILPSPRCFGTSLAAEFTWMGRPNSSRNAAANE